MAGQVNFNHKHTEILIVEDSPTQLERLSYLLNQNGYKVISAKDAAQALAILRERSPGLVVSDIVMPTMSGFDLCRRIKGDSSTAMIPVILLTALSDPEDLIEGLACGADDFITKPYSEKHLITHIEQILASQDLFKDERTRLITLLISTYESAVQRNTELVQAQDELRSINEHLEELVEQKTAALSAEIVERQRAQDVLKASEARFRRLIEADVNSALLVGHDGVIHFVNPAAEILMGRSAEELLGRDFGFPVVLGEKAELAIKAKDGRMSWVEMRSVAMDWEGEKNLYLSLHDITERKQFEDALRVSEARHRAVVHSANDAIISADGLGMIKEWNRSAEEMFGFTEGEVNGQSITLLMPAHFADAHKVGMARLLSGGKPHIIGGTVEIVGLHKEGRSFPIELSLSEWQVAGQNYYTAFIRDITERKQSEAEREQLLAQIQEQAQRVQRIVDTVPEGVILLDAYGQILLANPVAEKDLFVLAQCRVGDILNGLGECTLAELLAPSTQGWHEVHANKRIFEVIARPITHATEPDNWVLVIDDVTYVRDQNRYQQIQERLATVGQLAAGIAHDFNNIMGAIVLYSGMLSRSPDISPRSVRYLDVITAQAGHASKLIRQILDFSRRAPMERSVIDLPPLLKELVKMLERTLPENIKLTLQYDQNQYQVNADPTRLQQALMNLVLNARDAMPDGGSLSFDLTALSFAPGQPPPLPDMVAGSWVRLNVADTGTGIAPDNLPHIYEPFFTTKELGSGTGLGLAQVYGIVKQHDGAIDMTSQVGEGTTFSIYLPIVVDPQTEPTSADLSSSPPHATPSGTETILLVEDNLAMRKAVLSVLEERGYRVLEAATGTEALALFMDAHPTIDLVITDLVMPEMGGLELYDQLHGMNPALKILIMTGHALKEGGFQTLIDENVPWILKPFSAPDLTRMVRTTLDGPN